MTLAKRLDNKQPQIKSEGISWPTTSVKSNGNGYINQNRSCGQFKGKLSALRPIQSRKDPTVFAVIDIEVHGMAGKFQDFLHFNPEKEDASMSFLVNRVKAIAASAGYDATDDEEHDIDWVKQSLNELIDAQAEVNFTQEAVERGLDIQYA